MILFLCCFIYALSPRSNMPQLVPLTQPQSINVPYSSTYEEAIMNIGRVQLPYLGFHVDDLRNALQTFSIVYDRCLLEYKKHFNTTLPQVKRAFDNKLYTVQDQIKGRELYSPFETPRKLSTFLLHTDHLDLPKIVLREEPSQRPPLYKKGYQKTYPQRKKEIQDLIQTYTFEAPFDRSLSYFCQLAPAFLLKKPISRPFLLCDQVPQPIATFINEAIYPEILEFLSELAIRVLTHKSSGFPIHFYRHYYQFYYYLYHLLNALEAHELAICLAKEISESLSSSDEKKHDLFKGLYLLDLKYLQRHAELSEFYLYPSVRFGRRRNLVFGTIAYLKHQFMFPQSKEHPFLQIYGVLTTNYPNPSDPVQVYSVVERASCDIGDFLDTYNTLDSDSILSILKSAWRHIHLLEKMSIVNFDTVISNSLMYHCNENSEQCLNDFDVAYFYSNPNPNFNILLSIVMHVIVRVEVELEIPSLYDSLMIPGFHSDDPFKYRMRECVWILQLLSKSYKKTLPAEIVKNDALLFFMPFACQLARAYYHPNKPSHRGVLLKWMNLLLERHLKYPLSYPFNLTEYCQPVLLNQRNISFVPPPSSPPQIRRQKPVLVSIKNSRKTEALRLPAIPLQIQLTGSSLRHHNFSQSTTVDLPLLGGFKKGKFLPQKPQPRSLVEKKLLDSKDKSYLQTTLFVEQIAPKKRKDKQCFNSPSYLGSAFWLNCDLSEPHPSTENDLQYFLKSA